MKLYDEKWADIFNYVAMAVFVGLVWHWGHHAMAIGMITFLCAISAMRTKALLKDITSNNRDL